MKPPSSRFPFLLLPLIIATAPAQEGGNAEDPPAAAAEEEGSELDGLREAAASYVIAYNEQDAEALAALFTEDAEISNAAGDVSVVGREAIQAHFEEVFADGEPDSIAVEVESVRFVAPGVALEDGTAHHNPPGGEETQPQSFTYTAVLTQGDDGWLVASSRTLAEVSSPAAHLSDLASVLVGEWTSFLDEARLDLAFGWDPTGHFLVGEMLTTGPDAEAQMGSMRFGWNPSLNSIVAWNFDSRGGRSKATWTPTEDGWLVHNSGTTADGEPTSVVQNLRVESDHELTWTASHRVINGEAIPDREIRIVRQTPEPETP